MISSLESLLEAKLLLQYWHKDVLAAFHYHIHFFFKKKMPISLKNVFNHVVKNC